MEEPPGMLKLHEYTDDIMSVHAYFVLRGVWRRPSLTMQPRLASNSA